jgi:hypothetical protein
VLDRVAVDAEVARAVEPGACLVSVWDHAADLLVSFFRVLALYIQQTYTATSSQAVPRGVHMSPVAVQPVSCLVVADESEWKVTKHRSIRLEDGLWGPLEPAARASGYDRSGVIRQFVRWYLRIPGAKLPQRPDPGYVEKD